MADHVHGELLVSVRPTGPAVPPQTGGAAGKQAASRGAAMKVTAGARAAVEVTAGARAAVVAVTLAVAVGAASGAAGAALTGCSGGTSGSPSGSVSGSVPGSVPAGSASPSAATATTAPPPGGASGPDGAASSSTVPGTETAKPSAAITTLPPVGIGQTATVTPGVRVNVGALSTLTVTASAPGDTSGPAVSFVVEVGNESAKAVDLGGVSVTVSYGKGVPAAPSNAAPNSPLNGSLPPGKSARGTYVFRVPPSGVGTVHIQVTSSFAPGVAVFRR